MSSARTEAEEQALAGTVEVTMPETGSPNGARVIAWRRRPGELVDGNEPLCVVAWDARIYILNYQWNDEASLLINSRKSKEYKNLDPLPSAFIGRRRV
jgi:hypothetical protein